MFHSGLKLLLSLRSLSQGWIPGLNLLVGSLCLIPGLDPWAGSLVRIPRLDPWAESLVRTPVLSCQWRRHLWVSLWTDERRLCRTGPGTIRL